MLYNPFKSLKKREWILLIISLFVVTFSLIFSKDVEFSTLAASLIGVTALVFLAKGDVWGQILTIVFAILYSITSLKYHYYGEAVTYLGMTAPAAAAAVVSWLKNPYGSGKNEVKIAKLSLKLKITAFFSCAAVTAAFYFLLSFLKTPNLTLSTLSISTSFLASFLTIFRSSFYALAYAANDIILIGLWILASIENPSYTPMIFCFIMFLINDLYGFFSWRKREKEQK